MKDAILITGAAGFTGRFMSDHLVRTLGAGVRIIGVDVSQNSEGPLDDYYKRDIVGCSLQDLLTSYKPKYIIHLAGVMPPASSELMWSVNVGSTMNLFCQLFESKIKPDGILVIGSAAEYVGAGKSKIAESHACCGAMPYGKSKYAQTQLALSMGDAYGLRAMVARPFNLVGPGLSSNLVAGALCSQFLNKRKKKLDVGNIESVRDFIDIRDVVSAYLHILEHGKGGEIYNVCSGIGVKIKKLIDLFKELSQKDMKLNVSHRRMQKNEIDRSVGDNGKLKMVSNWEPKFTLKQSISDMLQENND